jgi:hypothetical protein
MIEFQFLMLFSVISGKACHWKTQQPKSPDIHPWLEIILAKSGVCDHHRGTNGFWISGPEIIRINTVDQEINVHIRATEKARRSGVLTDDLLDRIRWI